MDRTEEWEARGRLAVRVSHINALLRAEYGSRQPSNPGSPTDSLIATILSQHTADRNSGAAWEALTARYGTWDEILQAPREELGVVIRAAGLANIKARYIQSALRGAKEQFGTLDLSFLRDLPMAEAERALRSLPGVGPKTAACVLLFSCGHPAMPVDTHVHRLARRLGLVERTDSAEATYDKLARVVKTEDAYDFHVNLIAHGRKICKAREPLCGMCILQQECAYFSTHFDAHALNRSGQQSLVS